MSKAPEELDWQRSAFCASSDCAEVAISGGTVQVRNSDRPNEVVTFTLAEWEALKRGVRHGQF